MKTLTTMFAAIASATLAAAVLDVPVTSGTQEGYTEEQLAAIAGGEVTEIRKTGAGTLVSTGIKSFAGTIRVSEGLVRIPADDKTGLGTAEGPTVVESGAAISFGNSLCGSSGEELRIAGTGIDGGGAVIGGGYVPLGKLALNGDAKIVMGDRALFSNVTGGFLDLDGHTLVIASATPGKGEYYFAVAEVRSVGTVVADNFNFFRVASDIPAKDGKKGKFILRGTTALLANTSASVNRDIEWDLEWEAGGSGTSYVTAGPYNWSGDWILGAGRTVSFDPKGAINLYGNLLGEGSLQKGNAASGVIRLHGSANTFTGNILIRGGCVVVMKKAGLIDDILTRVQFTNSDLAMFAVGAETDANPDGFASADIQAFFDTMHDRTSGTFGAAGIYVDAGETFVTPLTIDAADTLVTDGASRSCDKFKFGSCGGGTCVITGPFVGAPTPTFVTYGDLRLSNPADDPDRVNVLGKSIVKRGNVTFADAGVLDLRGALYAEGVDDEWAPCLSFTNTVVVNSTDTSTLYAPNNGNAVNGKAEFLAGAVYSNRFEIASDGSACSGTIAARGGDVYVKGGDGYIGNIGQGCLLVESGRMYLSNHHYFGTRQTGIGQVFVSGGMFGTNDKTVSPGLGGTGVVYQTGGTIDTGTGGFGLGAGHSSFINDGLSHSQMSLAGGETKTTGWTKMGAGKMSTSFLNLIGGTLQTKGVLGAAAAERSYRDVAFDGGTLKAASTTGALLSGELTATVYGGGAVFDTAGYDVSLGHPLVAATGKGVKSVTVTNTLASTYMAPPVVCISGDGRGATAVPVYDFSSRAVTGIRVTSPGYGYTTATATLRHGGSSREKKPILLKVELADNVSPVKVTKRGAGSLSVAAGELPADTVLSVEEGSLTGAGVTFAAFAVDVAKAVAGHGSVPAWPDGAKLEMTGLDAFETLNRVTLVGFATPPAAVPELAADVELPTDCFLAVRGNALVLCRRRGFQLFLR